ncbi:MAG: zinc dependent phospholipase C family protein [Clostridiales bacterium]|nr:zinc dependent phospholipase C family protein [Clostridiales bacterium]
MRKKSHISLAKYLLANMKVSDLNVHKRAFYIGSILPDLKPSFLTKRHNIEETFDILIREIKKITVDYDIEQGINGYFARHLGVITHYLADYCTFPHNSDFRGSLKEHMFYEKNLKHLLKEYVERNDIQRKRSLNSKFHTVEDILHFIQKTHAEYMKTLKNIRVDIHYIVDLCYKVVDAILQFFEYAFKTFNAVKEGKKLQAGYLTT